MNTVIEIAKEIRFKIDQLEKMRAEIRSRAEAKATSISTYDRSMAKHIFLLKEKGIQISILDKLARGECWSERYDMELADGLYKSLISNMNCVQAELNGLQSINRHLSEA